MQISVDLINETGYYPAMYGLGLSYGITSHISFEDFVVHEEKLRKVMEVAERLAYKDGGHNKFLEAIYVWLSINAPRYWWQEADTYRISTKQSESTMHTIHRGVDESMFEDRDISAELLADINAFVILYNGQQEPDRTNTFLRIKKRLPESFMQRRIWCMNYKTLRNIILQRRAHRLPHWRLFCESILDQISYPTLLPSIQGVLK